MVRTHHSKKWSRVWNRMRKTHTPPASLIRAALELVWTLLLYLTLMALELWWRTNLQQLSVSGCLFLHACFKLLLARELSRTPTGYRRSGQPEHHVPTAPVWAFVKPWMSNANSKHGRASQLNAISKSAILIWGWCFVGRTNTVHCRDKTRQTHEAH